MVGELSRSQKSAAGEFGRDAHEKRPKDNEFARADEYFEIILVSSSSQYFEYVYVCYKRNKCYVYLRLLLCFLFYSQSSCSLKLDKEAFCTNVRHVRMAFKFGQIQSFLL